MYEYKVINGENCSDSKQKEPLESYLERILNEHAQEGWEFYTQNTIYERPGPGFLKKAFQLAQVVPHQVFVFRREIKK